MKLRRSLLIGLLIMLLSGCDFQQQADGKFGDQNFKTVIALVELH